MKSYKNKNNNGDFINLTSSKYKRFSKYKMATTKYSNLEIILFINEHCTDKTCSKHSSKIHFKIVLYAKSFLF